MEKHVREKKWPNVKIGNKDVDIRKMEEDHNAEMWNMQQELDRERDLIHLEK